MDTWVFTDTSTDEDGKIRGGRRRIPSMVMVDGSKFSHPPQCNLQPDVMWLPHTKSKGNGKLIIRYSNTWNHIVGAWKPHKILSKKVTHGRQSAQSRVEYLVGNMENELWYISLASYLGTNKSVYTAIEYDITIATYCHNAVRIFWRSVCFSCALQKVLSICLDPCYCCIIVVVAQISCDPEQDQRFFLRLLFIHERKIFGV